MNGFVRSVHFGTVSILILAATAGAALATPQDAVPEGIEALDIAFRFASAIDPDPKDKAKAQLAVVRDYAQAGALDTARDRAAGIDGWRQGVAYADVAKAYAEAGREEEARALVGKAERIRDRVTKWGPRVDAHIAQALAVLGDAEAARKLADEIAAADAVQYHGRAKATVASGIAAEGDFDRAMEQLSQLDDERGIDATSWRTAGYLELGRDTRFTKEQRIRALQAAHRSSEDAPGWKRMQALEQIANEYELLGEDKRAREALQTAETAVFGVSDRLPEKPVLITTMARAWAKIGEDDRARELLKAAEPLVSSAQSIEEPEIYAYLATGYLLLDDEREAWRVYDLALSGAESLVNARPRALAVIAICRSMGQLGVEPVDPVRERLDALYAGLGAPW